MARKPKLSTADQLVVVAQSLFAESGFKATTIQEIAKKAGVNVSLVSYHFKGKAGLFRACIEKAASVRLEAAESILTNASSFEEFRVRLEVFTDEILTYHVENPEVCTILHRDLHSEMELIGDIFEKSLLKAFEKFVNFIADAKTKGFLAEWVDPLLSAGNFYGVLFHVGKSKEVSKKYFGRSIEDSTYRREVRDYILKTTLYGVKS